METPANVSPPEFVMYCLERGYYLENRDAGVCFAPHCDPPRKAKAYLDTYQKEIAGLLQRDKSPSPSASAITVNVVSDVNIPVFQSAAESPVFTLPEVIYETPSLHPSVLAIAPEDCWEKLLNNFRISADSHHVIDMAKHLRLSQETVQSALDELHRRGMVFRTQGHPSATCWHIERPGIKAVEVPAVFYRGWPGNLDLSLLSEECKPLPQVAESPLPARVHTTQKELF